MAQIAKMEVQTEVSCSADKFYNLFKNEPHLLPKICPEEIKDVKLVHGNWGSPGSVKLWTYILGNNSMVVKEMLEEADEENKMIKLKILEGNILNHYKSFKSIIQVTVKENGSLVKWTAEYEKLTEDAPDPNDQLAFGVKLAKDIDARLLKAI